MAPLHNSGALLYTRMYTPAILKQGGHSVDRVRNLRRRQFAVVDRYIAPYRVKNKDVQQTGD